MLVSDMAENERKPGALALFSGQPGFGFELGDWNIFVGFYVKRRSEGAGMFHSSRDPVFLFLLHSVRSGRSPALLRGRSQTIKA